MSRRYCLPAKRTRLGRGVHGVSLEADQRQDAAAGGDAAWPSSSRRVPAWKSCHTPEGRSSRPSIGVARARAPPGSRRRPAPRRRCGASRQRSVSRIERTRRPRTGTTSARSLSSRGRINWHSGSPKRQLNSITFGPSCVSIRPAYRIPRYGWPSASHAGQRRAQHAFLYLVEQRRGGVARPGVAAHAARVRARGRRPGAACSRAPGA